MTRFKEACECPFQMAVMICFCIAGYIEQSSGKDMVFVKSVTGKWLLIREVNNEI